MLLTDMEKIDRAVTLLGENNPASPWLQAARQKAIIGFKEKGLPSRQSEAWRFTSLTKLKDTFFELAGPALETLPADMKTLLDSFSTRLVFVNGRFSQSLSRLDSPTQQIRISPLSDCLHQPPEWFEPHADNANTSVFANLNTGLMNEAAVIDIPAETDVSEPVHLLWLTCAKAGQSFLVSPRNLIRIGPSSKATLLESHIFIGEGTGFVNTVSQIEVAAKASLEWVRLQAQEEQSFHVDTSRVRVGEQASVHVVSFDKGLCLCRHDLDVALEGQGASASLDALFKVSGEQLVDHHTLIDHQKPRTSSQQMYKGVLDQKARGVFNGRIEVRAGAELTNASQTNKNLLLSEKAKINTKPQLEISNDNISCTHGATVGQLSPEELFYFNSRGIEPKQAREMLIAGFVDEIVAKVTNANIRSFLKGMGHLS